MAQRKIIEIDESKCDGCGQCVSACAEGAIRIIEGKARLVSETYCDGLGACLGECPRGAITIAEREAPAFDPHAVAAHLAAKKPPRPAVPHACPGMAVRSFSQSLDVLPLRPVAPAPASDKLGTGTGLGHWPIQLHLVPASAPFLRGADLLLVADCVPFALPDFHQRFLRGKPVVIGCPKLDDTEFYVDKLAQILQAASLRSLTVVHMEVPCCTGLVRIARAALEATGKATEVPLEDVTISIRGQVLAPYAATAG
jgi:Pyruvate/2-oxoacid:ferredoxin oxidoreductase delta subunit